MRDAHALTAYPFAAQARPSITTHHFTVWFRPPHSGGHPHHPGRKPAGVVMIERTDPYAVLGLTPQATRGQIRRAYLNLLRQNHPDAHPSDKPADKAASNTTLQQAIAAYATLGDPGRRAAHDHDHDHDETPLRIRVRAPMRFPSNEPDQPPIQAGPVHWHGSPR